MKCSLSKADWAVRADSPQADVSFCLFKGAFALKFLLLYLVLDAPSLTHDRLAAKVVVIGCSGFRACQPDFLDALEQRLGKPVVTSTQAFLWHMDT